MEEPDQRSQKASDRVVEGRVHIAQSERLGVPLHETQVRGKVAPPDQIGAPHQHDRVHTPHEYGAGPEQDASFARRRVAFPAHSHGGIQSAE